MGHRNIKAVIFDLDGTLADSLESIAYCANTALERLGYDGFDKEDYKQFAGDGAKKLLERCLLRRGDTQLARFSAFEKEYRELFGKYCTYHVKPYDGIVSLLCELKSRGICLAVLSNKPHERTMEVVQYLFGTECFDLIVGQREGLKRKPAPDGVYEIAEKMGIPVSQFAYVGDTNTDMQTGKGAGAFTVGVLWGFRDRQELEENHADLIIGRPDELLAHI
ncbi:MAG: HAD family hydrolase [Lachnospiraceae bacterium]|nr:HAD family hydrolase [Lachnospiraceae bacterium]